MENRNPENPKKRLLFQEKTFKLKKKKKKKSKNSLLTCFWYFGKWNFLPPNLKISLYLRRKKNKIYYTFQKKVMKIFFQNYFWVIVSIFSMNWIKQYYRYIKLFSAFRYFLLDVSSKLVFFIILLTFFQIVIYSSKSFSSFIIKNLHLVLSEYISYTLISRKNMHKSLVSLIAFVTNEVFKILCTKRKHVRYYYFINIYIVYQSRDFILKFVFSIPMSSNFIIVWSIFIYGFKLFL